MAYFHEALRGCIESGKKANRKGWAIGSYIYYDQANKRISIWNGGAGGWNDPTTATGSGSTYTLATTDIIDGSTGLPIFDWNFVG
jgi:hypothetical protein